MGKYIGQDLQYGTFQQQIIKLSNDDTLDEYTLIQRVNNPESIIVVCDRFVLRPHNDYVIVNQPDFTQKIKFNVSLSDLRGLDGDASDDVTVLFLGKELLTSSLPSLTHIQNVAFDTTLANGHVLTYDSESNVWKNKTINTAITEQFATKQELNDLIGSATSERDTLGELSAEITTIQQTLASQAAGQLSANAATTNQITSIQNTISILPTLQNAVDELTEVTVPGIIDVTIPELQNEVVILDGRLDALSSVALSGSYNDLSDRPSIPSLSGYATESYVDAAVAGVVDSAPVVLDTLNELSAALGNDENFATTVAGQIGLKADSSSLATVATSGSYTDLTNKPTIPSALDDLNDVAVSSAVKGQFVVHNGTQFVNARTIQADAAATVPLIVKGAASQTANLLEVHNSSGDSLASVDANGTFTAKRYSETVSNNFNTTLSPSSGTLSIDASQGTCVLGALNASVTTWAFTNVPEQNGKSIVVTVVLQGNTTYTYGDECSVNGSSISGGVKWSDGVSPTSTTGTDIISFIIILDNSGSVSVFGSASINFI